MNERIQKLAREAALAEGWGPGVWQTTFTEKFAELIVRECMEQVFYTIEDQEQDNISGSVRDRIKEHFGVEE
jgi:hypothetical protein